MHVERTQLLQGPVGRLYLIVQEKGDLMAKWVVAMLSALEKWKPGPTGRAIQEGLRTPFPLALEDLHDAVLEAVAQYLKLFVCHLRH